MKTMTKENAISYLKERNSLKGASANPSIESTQIGAIKPFKLAPDVPQTGTAGDLAYLESMTASQKLNAEKKEQQGIDMKMAEVNSNKSDINLISEQLGNQGQIREGIYQQEGVDDLRQQVDDYTSQLEAEQMATRRRIETLQKTNPEGLFGGALQDEVTKIERESLQKQADIAVLQNVANRRYDTAADIAERKLQSYLEPMKMKLDNLKFFYQENKEDLTTAQKNQLDAKIREENRNYEKAELQARTLEETKLETLKFASQQNAPSSVLSAIQSAQTPQEALIAAGEYGGDMLERKIKQAQLSKIYTDIAATKSTMVTPATLSNVQSSQYKAALDVIIGSNKFTKDQKAALINAVNNGEDPFTVIKNQAKNSLSSADSSKLTNYEVSRQTLEDIGSQLQQFYDKGGDTSLIKGNFEKVSQRLGKVNDPELTALATQLQGSIQVYRNAVSGTAYSDQEGRDIRSIFPGIDKEQELNNAILKGRTRLFDSVIDSTYKTVLGDTYTQLKEAERNPLGLPATKAKANDPLGILNN